jgi:hypothetical protein
MTCGTLLFRPIKDEDGGFDADGADPDDSGDCDSCANFTD